MGNLDDVLRTKTHKGQTDTVQQRVFYTLHDGKDLEAHRTSRLLALLIERLHGKGALSESDLDDMLLEIAG